MRILVTLVAALLLAGCAAQAPEAPPTVTPPPAAPSVSGSLIGLTAGEAMARLGQPVLQIREGPGLKLQWRGSACVLDAYLYLQGSVERITYVDTRLANGNNTPQPACIASLARS
jgi:hypothetical protein